MSTACSTCLHENRSGSFFCSQCGTKLHFVTRSLGALVRMNGAQPDKRIELPVPTCILGRGPEANVSFVEESVSKRHARLTVTDAGTRLEDLESSNGTFLNGRRIREAADVRPGDLLRLGSVILKYEA
jgi:pSer/pThr/pTyr-binding forkhead associated (FHA) protein